MVCQGAAGWHSHCSRLFCRFPGTGDCGQKRWFFGTASNGNERTFPCKRGRISFSLSQKLKTGTPLRHRLVLAYFLTDEIFGLSIRVPGFLNPFYSYGMITVASPAWILGSLFGVVLGNVLSARIVSALGISLFGMFLAIIIPPAKKDAVLLFFVTLAMLFSGLFSYLPLTSRIAPGLRTLLLTVGLSLAAALLFPRDRVASEAETISDKEENL